MDDVTYRIAWESVKQTSLVKYCNANPMFYKNTTQTVPNSQIPDEDWEPIENVTDNPWQQHRALKQWADKDTGFVRNVTLEKAKLVQLDWEPVSDA